MIEDIQINQSYKQKDRKIKENLYQEHLLYIRQIYKSKMKIISSFNHKSKKYKR